MKAPLSPSSYFSLFNNNTEGREVLEELCGLFYDRLSYVRGDTHETAFNEGAKSVINFVLTKMSHKEDDNNNIGE